MVVSGCARYALGVLGFWFVDGRGLQTLYMVVGSFFAGLFVPVPLFPQWLRSLAACTPFPSLLMAPVDVISGRVQGYDAVAVLAQQAGWVVALFGLGAMLTRAGRRRLEVQGG
jgi:ABC-2 type transport system permease protein